MKHLAEAILLAQKIREESFDQKEANRMVKEDKYPNFTGCYKTTMYEAADKAAEQIGLDESATQPIYLLNQYNWNDIQIWAESALKRGQ